MSNEAWLAAVPGGGQGKLLTPSEVAEQLGVSAAWVRDHATRKQPRIPVVKLGKLLRFRQADIQAFIEQQRLQPLARAVA